MNSQHTLALGGPTLGSLHAAIPHLLPSPSMGSVVGSACSQAPCSTLFVANLGSFVTEQELKDIFGRLVSLLGSSTSNSGTQNRKYSLDNGDFSLVWKIFSREIIFFLC